MKQGQLKMRQGRLICCPCLIFAVVHLLGIEPKPTEPESVILSIELQVRVLSYLYVFYLVFMCFILSLYHLMSDLVQ